MTLDTEDRKMLGTFAQGCRALNEIYVQAATLERVRAAMDYANGRWSEWGERAQIVYEMLDAALGPAPAQPVCTCADYTMFNHVDCAAHPRSAPARAEHWPSWPGGRRRSDGTR